MRSEKTGPSLLQRIAGTKKGAGTPLPRKELAVGGFPTLPERLLEKKPAAPAAEEGKSAPGATLVIPPSINKAKRTPYIDTTKLSELMMSPLLSTEGVRYVPPEEVFQDALHKLQAQSVSSKTSSATTSSESLKDDVKLGPPHDIVLCACGHECDGNMPECSVCISKLKVNSQLGYLYEKSDKQMLTRRWFRLIGNQLYSTPTLINESVEYTGKQDENHIAMYSLIGCLIREEMEELMQSKMVLYPFRLFFGPHQVQLYALKLEERARWVAAIKEAIGYSNLSDYYELKGLLGRGKFGLVRAAIHKKSGAEVAVKILNKSKLSAEDITLAKREIEILKLCQHPNIIQLLDTFENPDYIYIVMEILRGGDLYEYLHKRGFMIPEARARNIIHALATSLYYLHSYGIVHRDIKLDNVLMVDESDDSDIKLVDFGLSKMIGPNESCTEPFGTYGYAAPEVLEQKPYTGSVDIWGLGVVLYIMLTGHAPFEQSTEDKIAWCTVNVEPNYSSPVWNNITKEAKDCVMSKPCGYSMDRDVVQGPEEEDDAQGGAEASLDYCQLQGGPRAQGTYIG